MDSPIQIDPISLGTAGSIIIGVIWLVLNFLKPIETVIKNIAASLEKLTFLTENLAQDSKQYHEEILENVKSKG